MTNTKILDSSAVKFGDNVNNVDGVTITKSQNVTLNSAENISINGSSDIVIGNNCKDIEIVGAHDIVISDDVNNLHWLNVPIEGDYKEIQISYPKDSDVIVNGKPIAPIYQIYQVGDAIYAGVLKFSKLSTADNLTTYTFKIGTIIK